MVFFLEIIQISVESGCNLQANLKFVLLLIVQVIKSSGVIIKPIKVEEMKSYERAVEHKQQSGKKRNAKKQKQKSQVKA